jgi:4-hydroxy-4-methyl-2-oxoglutarate aldolase
MTDTHDLCARLRALPVAVMSDVLAAMGLGNRVLASRIRAIGASAPIAGPALCLGGYASSRARPPNARANAVFEMDRHITRGCIAVVATGGLCQGAIVGGNVGLSWQRRGCAGIVTDGGIRDAAEFNEMRLPVYCSFVTPMSNKGLWSFATIDEAIVLPGQLGEQVPLAPGDIVHADADGVIAIPAAHAAQAIADAEIYEAAEARVRRDIERGEDREVVYARHDRAGHIKRVDG